MTSRIKHKVNNIVAGPLQSGMYFYTLETEVGSVSQRMVLVR